jgi:hypothetical protein
MLEADVLESVVVCATQDPAPHTITTAYDQLNQCARAQPAPL